MRRHTLRFAVRRYSEIPLEEMADRVGAAMGIVFHEGQYFDMDASAIFDLSAPAPCACR
jgi:hypothetical protein